MRALDCQTTSGDLVHDAADEYLALRKYYGLLETGDGRGERRHVEGA